MELLLQKKVLEWKQEGGKQIRTKLCCKPIRRIRRKSTNHFSPWWGWWGGTRIRRVRTCLYGIRRLNVDTTQTKTAGFNIPLHTQITPLTPIATPWVLHNPIVQSMLSTISNYQHSVIKVSAALSSKYTLLSKKSQTPAQTAVDQTCTAQKITHQSNNKNKKKLAYSSSTSYQQTLQTKSSTLHNSESCEKELPTTWRIIDILFYSPQNTTESRDHQPQLQYLQVG